MARFAGHFEVYASTPRPCQPLTGPRDMVAAHRIGLLQFLDPIGILSVLESLVTLEDPSKNMSGLPLVVVRTSQSILATSSSHSSYLLLLVNVYLTSKIYDMKTDYDIWNLFQHMQPCAAVVRCPPLPFNASALVRPPPPSTTAAAASSTEVPRQTPEDVSKLMASRIPRRAKTDPAYWFTVEGLLKLVENVGYRSVDQVCLRFPCSGV